MSNVIKAYTVRYDNVDKITINNHFNLDKKLEEERREIKILTKDEQSLDGEFVEGLKAVVVEEIPATEDTTIKAEKLLEEARKEADLIIEKAKIEAEKMKEEAFTAAQKKGYDEGSIQVKREAQKLETEYEEKTRKLQNEYDDMMRSIEPQMVGLMASMVEKITGILVENNEEVILYLIQKTMKNLDKSNSYTVKVSKEDFENVSARKDVLLETVGNDSSLNITEDFSLTKNQCLIETDSKVINCSLDVQLSNLITDLKLISGI